MLRPPSHFYPQEFGIRASVNLCVDYGKLFLTHKRCFTQSWRLSAQQTLAVVTRLPSATIPVPSPSQPPCPSQLVCILSFAFNRERGGQTY